MDTPVVNGVAYPVLHVAPAAYRFQILSAGNDRSWNLSWFVADPTQNTEVAMLPAAPPSSGSAMPLCTAVNPVAVPSLALGLDTALLDNLGNPLNGTGLPAGCWPNYGPQPGIPAPQTMWAADGRAGGAPDPRYAGPPWIQIGSEGGLLPAPAVIPATPINYEQNTRSITITSVAVHGLWLGPAERADAVVDFSQFAGKTLILYNDAPTPAPAFDSRLDYFTGDGDQVTHRRCTQYAARLRPKHAHDHAGDCGRRQPE
jgi:FtsP/CotA-like multicopper oxidase with cupredoxin domain